MSQNLIINGDTVPIIVTTHPRSKKVKLRINQKGEVQVTKPRLVPKSTALKFAHQNIDWIENQLKQHKEKGFPNFSQQEITELKIKTRELVRNRLEYYNRIYNFSYHRITVRNQTSRWGSCSSHKTLSFNCRLCLLPPELADYVVVHELCHLKEMNHSSKFWDQVARALPDYKGLRRRLKRIRL